MKRDINLIPKDKKVESVYMIVFNVAGILMLLGIFTVAGILYPMSKKTMLIFQNNSYERELERYKGVERELTVLQQKLNDIEGRKRAAQILMNEQNDMTTILMAIQKSSPTSLQLNTLSYDMNGMTLEGWVSSAREVAQLVVNLRKTGFFLDVMVDSIETEKGDSKVKFNIQCLMDIPKFEGEEAEKEGAET
ncbi:MAG: PilN domain-containing protein [Clostridia bacterium]|jgi:Tfp pilus assembly protein PilN